MTLKFESTESPADEDVAFIRTQLQEYNRQQADERPNQKLAVYAREEDGTLVGGATGLVNWGWLFIDLLWVHETHRGRGVGSQLLAQIENLARQYNVIGYHLGTTDFQALDFYLNAGYEVWGQLADLPPGHTNYALRKLIHD